MDKLNRYRSFIKIGLEKRRARWQWLLVSCREAYEPGTAIHRLWLSPGGSAGHNGLWATNIDEGVIDEHFGGRRWDVSIMTPNDSKQGKAEAREDKRTEQQRRKETAEEAKFLDPLHDFPLNLKSGFPLPFFFAKANLSTIALSLSALRQSCGKRPR